MDSAKDPSQVVLFDMDGTLVDTERLALNVIEDYFVEKGHPLDEADLESIVGRTWVEGVEILLARYPIKVSPYELETEILRRFRNQISTHVPPVPGSAQFVRTVAQHYRVAIVSGSRRVDIEHNMKNLGVWDCFERIFGFEDYNEGKPSPDPYLTALRILNVDAAHALVFEDTEVGIRAARGAGIRVVAIGKPLAEAKRLGAIDAIPNFNGIGIDAARRYFTLT